MTRSTLNKMMVAAICLAILVTGSFVAAQREVNAATTTAQTAANKKDAIIAFAKSLQGKVKYKYGVNNPSKLWFDCSSFTKHVFASQGISLKWGSQAQSKQGVYVAKNNLQKGDLVFFSVSKKGKINHVGIYIGNGMFIHNTTGSNVNGVIISDLNKGSYPSRYITARRVS